MWGLRRTVVSNPAPRGFLHIAKEFLIPPCKRGVLVRKSDAAAPARDVWVECYVWDLLQSTIVGFRARVQGIDVMDMVTLMCLLSRAIMLIPPAFAMVTLAVWQGFAWFGPPWPCHAVITTRCTGGRH